MVLEKKKEKNLIFGILKLKMEYAVMPIDKEI